MELHIRYNSGNNYSSLPDSESIPFARKELASYKSLRKKEDDTQFCVRISNVLTWDAFRMLLLTEFPEIIPDVKWFVDNREIKMTPTMSYMEYVPEHGIMSTILCTIIRHNKKVREEAKKEKINEIS